LVKAETLKGCGADLKDVVLGIWGKLVSGHCPLVLDAWAWAVKLARILAMACGPSTS
jgi:hypothetical protein